jgi:small subunit ribosomal protein S1
VIDNDSDREPSESPAPTPEPGEPGTGADTGAEAPRAPEAPEVPEAEVAPEPEPEAEATEEATPAPEAKDEPASQAKDEPASEAKDEPAAETKEKHAPRQRMSRSRQLALASLYRAHRSGRTVEGTVEAVIKGGYEIRLGKLRGFCPHSQIDAQRVDDPQQQLGKAYGFKITQLRRGGDDIVVSRRAVLEDEQREEAKAVRATLIEGAVMLGHVSGVAEFGAFVDLGAGVMGLVHVSELSHTRVTRVGDAVKVGDAVNVKILKLDEDSKRISLSIRQATEDPWSKVGERFAPGKIYPGTIKRLTDFGAFVELQPGVEALAPASEFPPSRAGWREGLEAGEKADWLVLSVDPLQQRISVTPPVEGTSLDDLPPFEAGAEFTGKVQRVEKFGVFVWLGPGRVGLMPNVWTGTPRGEDLARRFPVGDEIEVRLVEVTEGGRRIRLARKGVDVEQSAPVRRERHGRERRDPRARSAEERGGAMDTGGPFGTLLAEKLRAALGQPDDDED